MAWPTYILLTWFLALVSLSSICMINNNIFLSPSLFFSFLSHSLIHSIHTGAAYYTNVYKVCIKKMLNEQFKTKNSTSHWKLWQNYLMYHIWTQFQSDTNIIVKQQTILTTGFHHLLIIHTNTKQWCWLHNQVTQLGNPVQCYSPYCMNQDFLTVLQCTTCLFWILLYVNVQHLYTLQCLVTNYKHSS